MTTVEMTRNAPAPERSLEQRMRALGTRTGSAASGPG
jgi:hypothetical protein